MKTILTTVICFTISFFGYSQTTPEEIVKKFLTEFPKNSDKALDELHSTSPWASRIKDAIENMKSNFRSYTEDYVGKCYGYELITQKSISNSFLLTSYLIKYDRQPMRFTFEFYKPNDKWTLYSFNVDTDLDDELEQAAKIYNLN